MKTKTGRDAIVLAFSSAYEANANVGSKIGEACAVARSVYKGAEVPKEDADYIAGKIADSREWEGATRKVRMSECRKVLRVYSVLPEGIASVRKDYGGCNWRDALRLATLLKEHEGKLKPALAAFGEEPDPRKVNYAGRAAAVFKKWYKAAKGDKRKAIIQAANILGVELGNAAA